MPTKSAAAMNEEERLLHFRIATGLVEYIQTDYVEDMMRMNLQQLGERMAGIAVERARETHKVEPKAPGQFGLPLMGDGLKSRRA